MRSIPMVCFDKIKRYLSSLIECVFCESINDRSFTSVHLSKEYNFILDVTHLSALLWVHFLLDCYK